MSLAVMPSQAVRFTVEMLSPAAIFQGPLLTRSLGPGLVAQTETQKRNFSSGKMLPYSLSQSVF